MRGTSGVAVGIGAGKSCACTSRKARCCSETAVRDGSAGTCMTKTNGGQCGATRPN